jgi:hypothetical protein
VPDSTPRKRAVKEEHTTVEEPKFTVKVFGVPFE